MTPGKTPGETPGVIPSGGTGGMQTVVSQGLYANFQRLKGKVCAPGAQNVDSA